MMMIKSTIAMALALMSVDAQGDAQSHGGKERLILYTKPQTHAEAIQTCRRHGQHLADLTSANIPLTAGIPAGKFAWIYSWNGDNYQMSCMQVLGNTVTRAASCEAKNLVLCQEGLKPQPPCYNDKESETHGDSDSGKDSESDKESESHKESESQDKPKPHPMPHPKPPHRHSETDRESESHGKESESDKESDSDTDDEESHGKETESDSHDYGHYGGHGKKPHHGKLPHYGKLPNFGENVEDSE